MQPTAQAAFFARGTPPECLILTFYLPYCIGFECQPLSLPSASTAFHCQTTPHLLPAQIFLCFSPLSPTKCSASDAHPLECFLTEAKEIVLLKQKALLLTCMRQTSSPVNSLGQALFHPISQRNPPAQSLCVQLSCS